MSKITVKSVLITLFVVFAVYSVIARPEESAAGVRTVFFFFADAVRSVFSFFDALLT